MNAMDRESRNFFRKWLHNRGWWPIPPKYPTNKERDERIATVLADPNSEHQRKIRETEEEYIRAYNSANPSSKENSGCPSVIPKLVRDENKDLDLAADLGRVKTEEFRQKLPPLPEFEKENVMQSQQQKHTEEKTLSINPKTK